MKKYDIKDLIEFIPDMETLIKDLHRRPPVGPRPIFKKGDYKLELEIRNISSRISILPPPFNVWRSLRPGIPEIHINEDRHGICGYESYNILEIDLEGIECKDPSLEYILKKIGIPSELLKQKDKILKKINKAIKSKVEGLKLFYSGDEEEIKIENFYFKIDPSQLKPVHPEVLEDIFNKEKGKLEYIRVGFDNYFLAKGYGRIFLETKLDDGITGLLWSNRKQAKSLYSLYRRNIIDKLTKAQDDFGEFAKGWVLVKPENQ